MDLDHARKPEGHSATRLSRSLDYIERYRHGHIYTALAIGFATLGAGWTFLEPLGIQGNVQIFSVLAAGGVLCGSVVHAYLVERSSARLRKAADQAKLHAVRDRFETVLPRLDPDTAQELQQIIDGYESEVHELRAELNRRRPKDSPGLPVLVEAGVFTMGTTDGSRDSTPKHQVFVSSFLMDRHPVTNQQFVAFVNDPLNLEWLPENIYDKYGVPYYLVDWQGRVPPAGKWDHPVVWVSWFAAAAFCNWRSRHEGRSEVYRFIGPFEVQADFSQNGWRLPTEAEWEKAARAGNESELPLTITPSRANYAGHHRGTTPVGMFQANELGLFDMFGNIKEWCHDWYSATEYQRGNPVRDPGGPETGDLKAFRGGGWMDSMPLISACRRGKLPPRNTNPDFGFRCVRRP